MTESDRRRIYGQLKSMDMRSPVGPARIPPAGRARIWTAIALGTFWCAVAVLFFLLWSF